MFAPSLYRIAAAFHAGSEGPVISVDHLLLLAYRLLVLRGALLSCLTAADHSTGDRPDPRALTRVARDRTNSGAARGTAERAGRALAASNRRSRLLRWRGRRYDRRIDARGLLRPRITLGVVLTLLCRTLTLSWINDRP